MFHSNEEDYWGWREKRSRRRLWATSMLMIAGILAGVAITIKGLLNP